MAGTTRLWFRERALADVEAAAQWYAREAGVDVADAFVAALEAAYARIARNPGIGSPRWAHAVGMAGLRSLPVGRFPWLVFLRRTRGPYRDLARVARRTRHAGVAGRARAWRLRRGHGHPDQLRDANRMAIERPVCNEAGLQ